MKYTKGNWQIHKQEPWEQDDNLLIESVQDNPSKDVQRCTTPICTLTRFNADNNARLIVEAPNTYNALRQIQKVLKQNPGAKNLIPTLLYICEAHIAKVESS